MKLKKGFTLVEMLSVIIILGILSLIAIPTVNKIMKNAKISTFESSMVGLVNAGKLYYQSNTVLGQTMADKTFTFPDASGLEINGEAPKSGSMVVSSQGKIALAVSNGEYCAKKGYDETEISINEDIDNCVLKVDNNEESDTNIETILLAEDSKKLGGELPEFYATKSELDGLSETYATKIEIKELLEKLETYDNILSQAYPIGSIYMSVNETNPSTLFGGTWEKIEDRFLLGASTKYQAGTTGGEETHTLTIDEMPTHNHETHSFYTYTNSGINGSLANLNGGYLIYVSGTFYQGGSQPHNNMPPYLSVYMWKRIA